MPKADLVAKKRDALSRVYLDLGFTAALDIICLNPHLSQMLAILHVATVVNGRVETISPEI